MSVCEDLAATRKVLEDRSWTTGFLISPTNGACCILGAVGIATIKGFENIAEHNQETLAPAYEALAESPRSAAVIKLLLEGVDDGHTSEYDSEEVGWMNPLYRFNDDQMNSSGVFQLIDDTIASHCGGSNDQGE